MSGSNFYTKTLYKEFSLFATWLPAASIELGTVGTLDGYRFIPKGDLKSYGIAFEAVASPRNNAMSFKTAGGVDISLKAGAEQPGVVKGVVNIGFTKDKSILLELNGIKVRRIKDQIALAKQIKQLDDEKKWDRKHFVVTEVIEAKSGTIITSQAKGGSISIEASGSEATGIDLSGLDTELNVTAEKSIGVQVVGDKGLTPLFVLSGVVKKVFKTSEFDITKRGEDGKAEGEEVFTFGKVVVESSNAAEDA